MSARCAASRDDDDGGDANNANQIGDTREQDSAATSTSANMFEAELAAMNETLAVYPGPIDSDMDKDITCGTHKRHVKSYKALAAALQASHEQMPAHKCLDQQSVAVIGKIASALDLKPGRISGQTSDRARDAENGTTAGSGSDEVQAVADELAALLSNSVLARLYKFVEAGFRENVSTMRDAVCEFDEEVLKRFKELPDNDTLQKWRQHAGRNGVNKRYKFIYSSKAFASSEFPKLPAVIHEVRDIGVLTQDLLDETPEAIPSLGRDGSDQFWQDALYKEMWLNVQRKAAEKGLPFANELVPIPILLYTDAAEIKNCNMPCASPVLMQLAFHGHDLDECDVPEYTRVATHISEELIRATHMQDEWINSEKGTAWDSFVRTTAIEACVGMFGALQSAILNSSAGIRFRLKGKGENGQDQFFHGVPVIAGILGDDVAQQQVAMCYHP